MATVSGMDSGTFLRRPMWQFVVMAVLAFWLSASVILDTVIMPTLYTAGMMSEPDFAIAGYSLFWVFNRVELFCAALVLTGSLVLCQTTTDTGKKGQRTVMLASLLLVAALICTYGLTPQMTGLGMQLNLFNPSVGTPALMNSLHLGYWLLDGVKLVAGGLLLKLCWRSPAQLVS